MQASGSLSENRFEQLEETTVENQRIKIADCFLDGHKKY